MGSRQWEDPMKLQMPEFRALKWEVVYQYASRKQAFRIFGNERHPNLVVIHDQKGPRVKISYRAYARKTDSPIQAVRWYNEENRRRRNERSAANRAQSAAGQQRSRS